MSLSMLLALAQGGVVLPPLPPIPPVAPWMLLNPPMITLISLGFFAAVVLVTFPLIRAIARRLEGKRAGPDPAVLAELEDLRARVAELEQQQDRMREIEERIDFTERLLAQQREQARLPH